MNGERKKGSKTVVSEESGQLLLEILIAVAAAAVIVTLGAQMVWVGLKSNQAAAEKNFALGLAEETFEAVKNASQEKWQNLYNLSKGGGSHYYPSKSGGKWIISSSGDESVTVSGVAYTRYFFVENVSRDPATKNIESVYNAANDDPSTQKVTAAVSWGNGESVSASEYLERWRNKVCVQTSWSGVGSGTTTCPATTYGGASNIDTSGGTLKLTP